MLTRQRRLKSIKITESTIEKLQENNRRYVQEEIANGRKPEDSIFVQSNEMYQYLLRGWLQTEKKLLELEMKVRQLEKKPKGIRRASKK